MSRVLNHRKASVFFFSYRASTITIKRNQTSVFLLRRIHQHLRRTVTDVFLLGSGIHIK